MKAVAYNKCLPITDKDSLLDIDLPKPVAKGRDLLVRVKAIAVNPVDYKVRLRFPVDEGGSRVLGWDAVGEVESVGEGVCDFKPGDIVYYAGDLNRQGSNAEYQLVDERIAGHKPTSLSELDAAALPLTTITAWELLFEHLGIAKRPPGAGARSDELILVVGAAGGVGSVLVQIIKAITGANVIASASRQSSREWVEQLGADYVVDHSKDLAEQISALNTGPLTHIASLNGTEDNFGQYPPILSTFGKIAVIDDPQSLDVMRLKPKSQSLHFESMFARSMHGAGDMCEQGRLLNEVAELVDQGHIRTTAAENLGQICADNLKEAHRRLESRQAIGKIVLQGYR